LKTLLGEEFSAAINGRYLEKYYPSIEIDRWLQAPGLQTSDTREQPAFRKEAVFSAKNPNKADGQYWIVLPLAPKYSTLQMFLASFYLTTQLLNITKGWEAEGLEKEAKVCFIPLIPFSSSVPPSSTVPGPP
jgi:hypothetical protein